MWQGKVDIFFCEWPGYRLIAPDQSWGDVLFRGSWEWAAAQTLIKTEWKPNIWSQICGNRSSHIPWWKTGPLSSLSTSYLMLVRSILVTLCFFLCLTISPSTSQWDPLALILKGCLFGVWALAKKLESSLWGVLWYFSQSTARSHLATLWSWWLSKTLIFDLSPENVLFPCLMYIRMHSTSLYQNQTATIWIMRTQESQITYSKARHIFKRR